MVDTSPLYAVVATAPIPQDKPIMNRPAINIAGLIANAIYIDPKIQPKLFMVIVHLRPARVMIFPAKRLAIKPPTQKDETATPLYRRNDYVSLLDIMRPLFFCASPL